MPLITEDLALCTQRLRDGHLLAMPTETVYGLAADARNDEAVHKVFALKGRPSSNQLIVHLHDAAKASEWASLIPPQAARLMAAFWPLVPLASRGRRGVLSHTSQPAVSRRPSAMS